MRIVFSNAAIGTPIDVLVAKAASSEEEEALAGLTLVKGLAEASKDNILIEVYTKEVRQKFSNVFIVM